MRITKYLVFLLVFIHNISFADGLGIGANIGSTGVGIEGRFRVSEMVFVRGGISGYSITKKNVKYKQINTEYDRHEYLMMLSGKELTEELKLKDIKLVNIPILLDFHPILGSGLRFSAGVSYFYLQGNYSSTVNNYETYNIKTENKNKFAPVLSLGYDNSAYGTGIAFSCEVGLVFHGGIKSKEINPLGKIVIDRWNMLTEAARQEARVHYNKEVGKFSKVYPIISLGLKFSL